MEKFPATDPNPVLSVDKDGVVLYSNKASEVLLDEWGVGVGEKLPPHVENIVCRVISQNNPEKMEIKVGKRVYLVVFHSLPEQECVYILGFDINYQKKLDQRLLHLLSEKLEASSRELRKLNEALINSESKYWHIVENSNDGIFLLDRNDITVFVNQKVSDMLGYSSYEICGHSLKKFLAPKFRSVVDNRLRKYRQKVGKFNDYQFIRKDGSDLWCIVSTHQFLDDRGKYNGSLGMLIDITKRKKVEEKLRESEERYRNIVETANEGIYLVNEEDKITYANNVTTELSGYTLEEIMGRSIWDFISEESKPIVKINLEKRRQDINVSYELKLIRKDGSSLWVFVSAKPFFNKEGKFTGFLGMLTDINERKIAEEKLRQSEEKYRNIVETSNEGIYFVNDEGRVTFANKMMETSGYSLDEIIGRPVWNFIPEGSLPVAKKEFEKRRKGISGSYELKLIRKDGSYIWTHITAKPFFNKKGKFKGYLAMMTDITERKEAEEKLQESEEKYRNIVEIANEGILVIDSRFRVTFYNQKMIEMLGYDSEEGIGRPIWDFIKEDSKSSVTLNMKKRQRGIIESYELELICKDGSSLWVLLNAKSLFDKDGKFMGSISMISDITERKRVEETLANIILPNKEIHHRIKKNLHVISSLLDLQAEQFKGRMNIKDSEVLEAFRESQDRVLSMALVHEELYKGEDLYSLNFSHYIEKLANNLLLTNRIGNNGISLDTDIEEDIFIHMDTSVPLGMVINELASNSLKHAFPDRDDGEIRIGLHREECKNQDYSTTFILTVSDNGIGIPEDIDIENPNSLGLQLVTTLVDQLDGGLELRRDKGTKFTIRFMVTENNNSVLVPTTKQSV
jgi:PAS domain S-box-containing protein